MGFKSFLVKVDKIIQVPHGPVTSKTQLFLTNNDLDPVPIHQRKWGPWNFVAFWLADSININTWMIVSSSVLAGLSWWETWLCVWAGYSITACFIVASGRMGAVYHISFPVINRASFGIWGSLWPVFNRGVMACIWYGVQSWIGGECVYIMLRAIFPSIVNLPNGIPGSGTDTKSYLCFFLFWLFSLPAIWFPVYQIRHLFTVKSYTVPVAGVLFMVWAIVKAGGVGPIVHQPSTVHGSAKAWAVIAAVMDCVSNFATLIVNDPDFARFAKKPRDALWSQLFTIPIGFALTSFIGVIVSSSSNIIYGQPIWNPLDLLNNFLNDNPNSATRAGVFFIALAFALAQLGVNIAANSVSAGNDLSALMPRYINIRRGGYIAAAVGIAMCPWKVLSSSSNFTSYLSSYSVFLSSIAGVIFTDYYAVRKGYFCVPYLYSADHDGPYWYAGGFNPKAYVAYVFGIVINVVGFAGAVGQTVPIGATYIYRLNFFAGFIVASLTYYILNRIWPAKAVPERWTEDGNQDVVEARLAQIGDYEQGDWKVHDGHQRLESNYRDQKLHPTDSPTEESNFE